MPANVPLKNLELIDCAMANSSVGIEAAAESCGYGANIEEFEKALREAADYSRIDIRGFHDLLNIGSVSADQGIEIAPDTPSQL
ncbi:MAG TPA: hypothetical protein V6D19_12640 [Stenomitos sp.]